MRFKLISTLLSKLFAAIPITPGRFKRQVLSRLRWLFHPISVFVIVQILWAVILTLWIVWFIGRRREIERLASQLNPALLPTDDTTVVILIVVGIILLSIMGAGTIMLFAWGQRQTSLIQQQRHFVSSVTHELRTPLASIQLAYETMTERPLDDSTRKQLLTMSRVDIDRLIRLVNQILISSRLDRGIALFNDDIKLLSISDAINRTIATLIHLDPQIISRIKISCPPDLNWRGSNNAFNMVLTNLLENAIKYSQPKSPIEVIVTPDKDSIKISVKDYGLGLSKRDRKRIFKMFYRSQDATSRAIPGTGLGLFIVKTTLEQLGGRIEVDSPGLGDGTKFTASFPT